jgi:hypothetical protein
MKHFSPVQPKRGRSERTFAPKNITFSFPPPREDDYERLARVVRRLMRESRLQSDQEAAERGDVAQAVSSEVLRGWRD